MYRYPRDEDTGRVDLINGTYRDTCPSNTRVKYEKEVRFALGVAMVEFAPTAQREAKVEGVRCDAFNYTNKTIIPEEEFQQRIGDEIHCVKHLPGDSSGNKGIWTVDLRNGRLFDNDDVTMVRGWRRERKQS